MENKTRLTKKYMQFLYTFPHVVLITSIYAVQFLVHTE